MNPRPRVSGGDSPGWPFLAGHQRLPLAAREGRVGPLLRPGKRGMQRSIAAAILVAVGLGSAGCRSDHEVPAPAASATPAAVSTIAPTVVPPPAAKPPEKAGGVA